MELPALKLPDVMLPFDIPTLMHPPLVHFAIAIPVIVILIDIVNLVLKKRAIGVLTFFMLLFGVLAFVASYRTGLVDGKEAFDALTQAGQEELHEHKLLGTYLVIGSAVVLLFKVLAATIKKGLIKGLYLLVLAVFIAGVLKQGKDGGELVYEYGANVERVQTLQDALDDTEEKPQASPTQEVSHESTPEAAPAPAQEAHAPATTQVPEQQVEEAAKAAVDEVASSSQTVADDAAAQVAEAATPVEDTVNTAQETLQSAHESVEAVVAPEAATEALPHH